MPVRTAHVWRWFRELCLGRQRTDSGAPLPIAYAEIEAWARMTGKQVRPFEVHLLKTLDVMYLSLGV